MQYKGFEIEIVPSDRVIRWDKNGKMKVQNGFIIAIYADFERTKMIEKVSVCQGYELMNNTIEEALEFAQDLIECEMKAFREREENL